VICAHNIVSADYFKGLGDRLTPASIIPMHTPDEAIAELEFVTRQLGSRVDESDCPAAENGSVSDFRGGRMTQRGSCRQRNTR